MKKRYSLILSFIIQIIVILWAFLYYKVLFNNNMLISLDDVSAVNILNVFLQHIIANLPIIIFYVIATKNIGNEKIFFNIPDKRIWKLLLVIGVIIYCALILYALNINNNIIKVIYAAVFYLLFVSFMEEYIYRGLVPALQKNELPKVLEWLLPNVIFTLSHYVMLFVESSGINEVTVSALITFFISTIIFGIMMELLKRKSNSLYIPILIHAIYDFYGEIMLWL